MVSRIGAGGRVPEVMGALWPFRHMRMNTPMPRICSGRDRTVIQDSWPHTLNVVAHILFGTAAVALGMVQLLGSKGGNRHRFLGRLFVGATWIVVATAATGLVAFRFGAFLAVLTLLVAYWTYSGVRSVRIRHTGPTLQDGAVAVCGLVAVALFLFYLPNIRFPWVPTVIYSTLGTLTMVALYDLSRFAFPKRWFESLWLYEHLVKMIGAHGAIVAAFSGTVLPSWQPYSQIVPVALWTALQLGFVIHLSRRSRAVAAIGVTRGFKTVERPFQGRLGRG
jgi:uncharacterized membrane protein